MGKPPGQTYPHVPNTAFTASENRRRKALLKTQIGHPSATREKMGRQEVVWRVGIPIVEGPREYEIIQYNP